MASSNSYRRGRNNRKIRRIIKRSDIPKELRKEVTRSYKQSMKIFSIRKMIRSQNLLGGFKKEGGKSALKIINT